jgi:hypothetical protein
MSDATCARCGSEILKGQGYAVYSEASTGTAADRRVFFSAPGPSTAEAGDVEHKLLDAMLYCEQCANSLFTDGVWANAKMLRIEMSPEDVSSPSGREAKAEVIDFSIALRMKRLGMAPPQARREARAFGKLWWTDQGSARRRLEAGDPCPNSPGAQFGPESAGTGELQKNGKAVASLLLGILSLLVFSLAGFFFPELKQRPSLMLAACVGLFAIWFGHVGRSEIKLSRGRLKGKWVALAGLILGYFMVVSYIMTMIPSY